MKSLFFITLLFICGCTNKPNLTSREAFDKYYDANIKRCTESLTGVDSIKAVRVCSCKLDKLYKLDSTFVFMEGKELNDFMKKNVSSTNDCDSIIK